MIMGQLGTIRSTFLMVVLETTPHLPAMATLQVNSLLHPLLLPVDPVAAAIAAVAMAAPMAATAATTDDDKGPATWHPA